MSSRVAYVIFDCERIVHLSKGEIAPMQTLVKTLNLRGNPFEHYTAETEPDIANYAVRPPYLQAISDRVRGLSSFILFGDRGAGKSAMRISAKKVSNNGM